MFSGRLNFILLFILVFLNAHPIWSGNSFSYAQDRFVPHEFLKVGQPAPNFSLLDQNGHPVQLHQFKGRPIILTFFFTSCQGTCPLILQGRARIEEAAQPFIGDHPIFVGITLDPETDTPAAIKAYISKTHLPETDLYLLTGSSSDIHTVHQSYRVEMHKDPDNLPLSNHTVVAYAIDEQGIIRRTLVFNF